MKKFNYTQNFLIIVALIVFVLCVLVSYYIGENNRINMKLKTAQDSLQVTLEELNVANDMLESKNEEFRIIQESLTISNIELEESMEYIETLNNEIKNLKESLFGNGQELDIVIAESDVEIIAKTVYGEARGQSTMEQAAVVWCILNRVDASGSSISEIVTAPNQFVGYQSGHPVTDEIRALVYDVLVRWKMEKFCQGDVGRVLPKEYKWFSGYDGNNHFRNAYDGDYDIWDWSCWNPYS